MQCSTIHWFLYPGGGLPGPVCWSVPLLPHGPAGPCDGHPQEVGRETDLDDDDGDDDDDNEDYDGDNDEEDNINDDDDDYDDGGVGDDEDSSF